MDIIGTLQRLGQGTLLDKLGRAITEVGAEVQRTGNAGKVTVTLTLDVREPMDAMVLFDEAVSVTMPKEPARGAFLFLVDGELHRDDPRQERMPFREVDRETGEVIERRHAARDREVS